MLRFVSLFLFLILLCTNAALAQNGGIIAPSTWENERGSTLTITKIDADGSFEGSFVNQAPGTQCKGFPYYASGTIAADGKITFAVAFADRTDAVKNCFTVTEWMGKSTGTTISTTWSLAYASQRGLTVIGGSDEFKLRP